jgi:hypothetical protein
MSLVAGDRVLGDDERAVIALDTASGREVWRTSEGGVYLAGAAGDTLYLKNRPSLSAERLLVVDAHSGKARRQIAIKPGPADWSELDSLT